MDAHHHHDLHNFMFRIPEDGHNQAPCNTTLEGNAVILPVDSSAPTLTLRRGCIKYMHRAYRTASAQSAFGCCCTYS